jgi:hypothetical protein
MTKRQAQHANPEQLSLLAVSSCLCNSASISAPATRTRSHCAIRRQLAAKATDVTDFSNGYDNHQAA